jgi:Domain of unknown function (DUF4157)
MSQQSALLAEAPPSKDTASADPSNVLQHRGVTDEAVGDPRADRAFDDPLPAAGNGSHGNNGDSSPNFSRLRVSDGRETILDEDAARALITRWLIHDLAPMLGLDASRIEIHVNSEAESRTNARGARGLMEGGRIYLHPSRYQPKSDEGRYLLAHEATHIAQLTAPTEHPVSAARAVLEAEREADEVAAAFVRARPIRLPQHRVPVERIMAQEATAAAATPGPSLEDFVLQNREREIARIKKRLSYGFFDWKITDGDITAVLREVEALDFMTIVAIAEALSSKDRARFADNLSAMHFAAFRPTILAFYLAILNRNELGSLSDEPFAGMSWTGLSPAEHYALYQILPAYFRTEKGRSWQTRNQKIASQVHDIIATKPEGFNVDDEREKARKQEEKVAKEREEAAVALQSTDVGDFLKKAKKKLSYGFTDWAVRDHEVLFVLDGMADFASDPAKLRAIVTELEREGLMDRMMNNLPVDALYSDVGQKTGGGRINRRRIFLQMAAMRPPSKNVQLAQDLLSKGLFDWAVTDEDAFLTQQLLKALPPRSRESFLAMKGGKYATKLDEELSMSMKKGETANFYQGGEEGRDLQKIKSQLLDDALWSAEDQTMRHLRMLIEMAIAAGEHDWVFAQTKDRYGLYQPFRDLYRNQQFFDRIIEGFGLYKPARLVRPDGSIDEKGREEYQGEKLKGKPFFSDNLLATIIESFGFLIHSERIQIFRKSIGGEGINFKEFQDIFGGSFLGAEFKGPKQVPADQAEALKDNSIRWDLDHGIFELRAARLDLSSINYPMANMKVQTARTVITNLHLHLEYPATESKQQTTSLVLRADSIEMNDLMLIFSDSMIGIEQLALDRFVIDLRPDDPAFKLGSPSDNISWGSVFSLTLSNLTKITGDLLFLIPTPATSRLGELTQGLFEPANPMAVAVTSQGVRLRGITTSGGQYVDDLTIKDFVVRSRSAASLDQYVEKLKEEKKRLESRRSLLSTQLPPGKKPPRHYVQLETGPSLSLQIQSIDQELKHIEEAKAEQAALQDKKQKNALSPADEHKLWRATKYLEGLAKGGMALDMASVTLSGLAGTISARDIAVGETHGYGQTAGAALGFMFSSTTMNRMLRGKDYRGTLAGIDEEGEPQFFLQTNKLTLKELAVEASIPTLAEAQKALKKAEDRLAKTPNDASLIVKRDRALVLCKAAETYWTLIEKPGALLLGSEREQIAAAKAELLKERSFFAELLKFEDFTLELGKSSPTSERVGVTAETVQGTRLESGGTVIGALDGKNVMIGAEASGGLSDLMKDWRKQMRSGQLAADSLVATKIVQASSGATVDRVALTQAGATVSVNDQGKLDLKAATVEVTGVNVTATRKLLEAEKDFLLMVPPAARHEADDKKILAIDESLKELDAYEELERKCQAALDEARKTGKPKDVAQAEDDLKFATFAKTEWQRRLVLRGLSIDQLNISVLGFGNVFDEDFDPTAAIAKGIRIEGGGAGGRWFDKAQLQGSRIPGLSGEEVKLGPTGGVVEHSESETVLKDFFIESIEATGLEFHAPPHHVGSRGTSTLVNLRGNATFTRERRPDKNGFETWQLATVKIPDFHIDRIDGQDLSYAYSTLDDFYTIEIASGSVGDVWVNNLQIDFTPADQMELHGIDPKAPGGAGIDQITNLKLVGFLGEKIKVGGKLNGTGLRADFIEAKKQKFTIDEITATGGTFSKTGVADLGFTVRKLGLAATRTITDTGDVFDIEKIKIASVSLHKGCTFTKGTTKVELLGSGELAPILLSAKIVRTKKGDKMEVTSAVVNDIVIPDITASKVHVTVPGKAADPAKGTKATSPVDVTIPNATIKDFHAWGVDVLNFSKGSFATKSLSLPDITVEIAKRGEAEFKKIDLTVTSEGLGGTLMGPGRVFLDLGKTDLSGSFEGAGLGVTPFSLKGIGGFVDVAPDYVRVFSLDTGPLKIGPVVHKDADGNRLDMASIDCPAVHLKDLQANWIKDPVTKEDKLSSVTISGLKFDKIEATGFKYRGRFTSENEKKEIVVSRLELDASAATLEPLVIENLNYDALKELINIEPAFEKLDITGFQASFRQWTDGKLTQKLKLATDVTGKAFKANLNFKNITSASGDAWKFSHGTYHIDEFGLKHPDIAYTYRDDKGELQELGVKGMPSIADYGFDLSGLDVTVMPDGTMFVDFDALAANHIRLQQKGGPPIDIDLAKLKSAEIAIQGKTPDKAFDILGATFKELELKGIKVEYSIDRSAASAASPAAALPWKLDALSTLNGTVHLVFTDAKFYVDAEVDAPIVDGVIDFDNVNIEHLGPNSAMGADGDGIYVDGLGFGGILFRSHIDGTANLRGLTTETYDTDLENTWISDRGALDLKEMVEGMMNDPSAGSAGGTAEQLSKLNRMSLAGTAPLTLGDSTITKGKTAIQLSGSAAGKNQITISGTTIGDHFQIDLSQFEASKLTFEAQGKPGETGKVTANITVEVRGLGAAANPAGHFVFTVSLTINEATVADLKWGNVAIVPTVKATAQAQTKADEEAKKAAAEAKKAAEEAKKEKSKAAAGTK